MICHSSNFALSEWNIAPHSPLPREMSAKLLQGQMESVTAKLASMGLIGRDSGGAAEAAAIDCLSNAYVA
jgi:hypothetical protein